MNFHALANFIAAIFILAVGIVAYLNNKKSRINATFLFLTCSAFIWQIGTGIAVFTGNPYLAEIGTKIGFFGIALIPVFSYHISLYISKSSKFKLLIGGYAFTLLLIIPMSWTSLILDGVYKYSWGYFFKAGFLHPIFMMFFVGYMLLAFFNLFVGYRREVNLLEKSRKKYFLIALLIAYLGSVDFLPTYGVRIYPFGYLMLIGFILIFAYAILKYRILDVKIVALRTLLFLFIYIPILATPFYLGWLTSSWIATGVLMAVFAPSGLYLYLYVQRKAEDVVKAKKLKYLEAINEFFETVKHIRTIEELMELILKEAITLIGVNYTAFYLVDREPGNYVFKKSKKMKSFKSTEAVDIVKKSHSLIEHLQAIGKPVIKEELKFNIFDTEVLDEIETKMTELNASVIIPAICQAELVSFIVLGDQRKPKPYEDEDIKAFISLGTNVGLAVKNSLFVDDLHNTQADLIIAEKFAAIGRLSDSAKHEISNPLHGMSGSFYQISEIINDRRDNYAKLRQRAQGLVESLTGTIDGAVESIGTDKKEELEKFKHELDVVNEAMELSKRIGKEDKAIADELTAYEAKLKTVKERLSGFSEGIKDKKIKEKLDRALQLIDTITAMAIGKVRDRENILEKEVNNISEKADRINRVITAMYGLPKKIGEEGKGIEVKKLIKESFDFARQQTYWENLGSTTTEIDVVENLPKLSGTKERLEIVFVNIITNAYQELTDAGIKDMESRILKVTARVSPEDSNFIEIRMANNGPMVPEENIDRIFAHGFTTKKDKNKHRGLGLYIAKVQIEVFSKGKIYVRNIEGFGPEFVITLPVWKEGDLSNNGTI